MFGDAAGVPGVTTSPELDSVGLGAFEWENATRLIKAGASQPN